MRRADALRIYGSPIDDDYKYSPGKIKETIISEFGAVLNGVPEAAVSNTELPHYPTSWRTLAHHSDVIC